MRHNYLLAIALTLVGSTAIAEPEALVTLAPALQGQLAPQITAYGTVASDPNYQLAVIVGHDSRIAEVYVRLGQSVDKGAPLIKIQSAPSSTAQFAQASSALSFAAKDLQQTRRLYAEQLATRSQLASAERAYLDAQAAIAQQHLMGADRMTETLVAPEQGVVATLVGARGDALTAGTTVATIASRASLVINLGIAPASAPDVHLGAAVLLRVPNSSVVVSTKIASIGSMLDPQSRLVSAVAPLTGDTARRMMVGAAVRARIVLEARRGIVAPRSALMSDRNGTYVFVVTSGVAHRRGVSIAFETSDAALVAVGLRAHEQVIASGATGITDGVHVRTR